MDLSAIIMLICSVALVGYGVVNLIKGIKLKKLCNKKTVATLVEVKRINAGPKEGIFFRPLVSYTANGIEYRGILGEGSKHYNIYTKGQKFEIFYNPEKPSQFRGAKSNSRLSAGHICLICGIALFFVAIYLR